MAVNPALAHARPVAAAPPSDLSRGPGGLEMLFAFPLAVLAVTLAVVALAASGRWWALGATMALDALVTTGVSVLTARLLADDGDA